MFKDGSIRVIGIVITIILLIFAIKMSKDAQNMDVKNKPSMFIKIEDGVSWDVYYNIITKVTYVISDSGDFVLLVNGDGSPMIFDEDYTYLLNKKGL